MNKFKKREIKHSDFLSDDNGIKISTLLSLIKDDKYFDDIVNYFKVNIQSDELIEVSGSKTLYNVLKTLKSQLVKVDLVSGLDSIDFNYKEGFSLLFNDVKSSSYLANLGINTLNAKPIHSAQKDFFSNLFEIDKYADKLIKAGFHDVLDQNLEMLKAKGKHERQYRLLHDLEDEKFYLRTVVSKDGYFDYNNNITFVIALLKLHFETKQSNVKYEIDLCEFNESFIKIYFRTSVTKELTGVGHIESILQVSNDEIRREAMKFSVICSIIFKPKQGASGKLFIKPQDIQSKVLSITHGTGPKHAFVKLGDFVKCNVVFEELFKDIEKISKIKNQNQIVHIVRSKIDKSTTEEVKRFKEELLKILRVDIDNTIYLLEVFNKMLLLEGLEIDAKEYLRYLFYQALVEKK